MTDYFNNLNEREKWMVVGGGICFIAFLYYALLYSPLKTAVVQQSNQLVEQTSTLAWMNKVKQEGHLFDKKKTLDNGQLLTLVSTQLKVDQTLNSPFQLEQTSSGDVQLSFDEVPFNLFITWLAKINKTYSITIKQFDVQKTKTAGVTKLLIILSAE